MKIIHVVKHFHPCIGGVENYCENLALYLEKSGYNNKIITLNTCYKSKTKLKKNEIYKNLPITRLNYINLNYVYKISPQVLKYINDGDIIIIHGHDFFVDFLTITKWIHKKKIILITHGGIFHTNRGNIFKKIYFYVWSRFTFLFVNKVIAISEVDFNRYKDITTKLELFENPVIVCEKSKVQKIKNQFIYVGRISENKKIENLIETFSYLKDINFNLIILGPDNDNKITDLKILAKKHNVDKKITFTGAVSEKMKNKLIEESEYFVSASEYEGFGLSLIECMSYFCIPIVQPNESFRKLITDSKNGFLVDYTYSKIAAEQILKIISRNNENISKIARQFSLNFSWDKKISEFIKIIKEVYDD